MDSPRNLVLSPNHVKQLIQTPYLTFHSLGLYSRMRLVTYCLSVCLGGLSVITLGVTAAEWFVSQIQYKVSKTF